LICPPDITVTLDPGACDIVLFYPDPTYEGGGCPTDIQEAVALTQNTNTMLIQDALACTGAGDAHWRAYDLAAMGVVGDFTMESLGMASWSAGTVQVFVYTYTGTLPSATLDLAQMTLVGQSAPGATGAFNFPTIPLQAPVVLPEGSKFVVEQRVIAAPGTFTVAGNYAGNSEPAYFQAALCGFAAPTSYPTVGFGQIHPIQVLNGSVNVIGAILVQISGLPSGSAFPIGTTTNCFQLIDAETDEVVDSCCFDVVVNEFPIQLPPACNDLVQISLDQNCEARICADVILEGGPYGCYDDFDVFVDQYPDSNVNCISLPFTPGLHTVTVVDPETGISCWGQFLIEDKLPPQITCQDFTLTCGQDLTPIFTPPVMGTQTCSQFPGLPIGPNAGVITTSTCQVSLPQGVEIVDVNVCVKITHTWIGDCNTDIISPAGEVTNLWGFGQCGTTDNMFQKFDDDGPVTVLCADINNGCDFILQPVAQQLGTPSLDQYIGGNPNGTWTLMITDNANGDGGTLDEWHLEIEYMQNAPFAPTVSDNCDGELDLVYSDEQFGEICDSITILRTWTVTMTPDC
jgi:subtilisin-like proprotein convertase family protein